jgi:hypothetical protein
MVNGFIMKELTSKGKHGIIACKKANLKKEVLSNEPLVIKFTFSRDAMKRAVKAEDVIFYLDHMVGLVGKRGIDWELEVF